MLADEITGVAFCFRKYASMIIYLYLLKRKTKYKFSLHAVS